MTGTATAEKPGPEMSIVPGSKQKKLFPQDDVAEWADELEQLRKDKGVIQKKINARKNKIARALVEHGLVNYDVTLKDDSMQTLGINSKLTVKNKKK